MFIDVVYINVKTAGPVAVVRFDASVLYDEDTNPVSSGVGYHIYTYEDGVVVSGNKHIGAGLHSQVSEYHAMFEAVRTAVEHLPKETTAHIQGDARNVVQCVCTDNDSWPGSRLRQRYVEEIRDLLSHFDRFYIKKVDGNSEAHRLSRRAHPEKYRIHET